MIKYDNMLKDKQMTKELYKKIDPSSHQTRSSANLYVFKDLSRNTYYTTKMIQCVTEQEREAAREFILKGLKLNRINQKSIAVVNGWDVKQTKVNSKLLFNYVDSDASYSESSDSEDKEYLDQLSERERED